MQRRLSQSPEAYGNYHESAESELKAVPGLVGDGAVTSISAMAAQEDAEHRSTAEPWGHGDPGAITQGVAARSRPSYVPPSTMRRDELASLGGIGHAGPGGLPLPPPGSTYAPPRRVGRLPTIERVTSEDIRMVASAGLPKFPAPAQVHGYPRRIITLGKKPAGGYFTACCLLSCLLALAIGFALVVVYLRYHPQPPQMRVITATLKNSTLGGRVTNYSLSIQAHIVNPNTELHIVLRYVQLDLYFQGSLVGTQAVWPAPIHEAPGDSVLRSAHLLVSVTQEHDVLAWQNATNESGGIKPLVELLLVGRFHSQLNFGRRLPFRFWVYPRCTLWLDPLRGGALRQSWC